jgi:hypothetical protein
MSAGTAQNDDAPCSLFFPIDHAPLENRMSHRCAKSGCAFRLPDSYTFPFCPWHAAPGNGVVKILSAAGILAVGVGGMFAYGKIRDAIRSRKTEAEQDEWRRNAEQLQQRKEPQTQDADNQTRDIA